MKIRRNVKPMFVSKEIFSVRNQSFESLQHHKLAAPTFKRPVSHIRLKGQRASSCLHIRPAKRLEEDKNTFTWLQNKNCVYTSGENAILTEQSELESKARYIDDKTIVVEPSKMLFHEIRKSVRKYNKNIRLRGQVCKTT